MADYSRQQTRPEATIDVSAVKFAAPVSSKLYSDVAEQAAKAVAAAAGSKLNKSSQLRRFYDEFVGLQSRVGRSHEDYERLAPFVQMLKAKVAYAQGRETVDSNFVKLLRHVVDEVHDPATLRAAKLFFEAFMAFYKLHGPDKH